MKHAKIIEGEPFDWKRGAEAFSNIANDDDSINWSAAFAADPGVTKCPKCKTFFWAEGTKLECTECGTQFPTRPPRSPLGEAIAAARGGEAVVEKKGYA